MSRPKIFRYSLNQKLRRTTNWIMRWATPRSKEQPFDVRQEQLERILIIRATFRMGDSILAIPAVWLFRKRFPHARIDFVGAPISAELFHNLPIDNHFTITRRCPGSGWDYPLLLRRLRSVGYDLAVDVSCSQSAMGSFLVGFSGARFRAGLKGRWDRWFNVRIARPSARNKYRILPAFLKNLGLESYDSLPALALSNTEKEDGKKKLQALPGQGSGRCTVGVFVGGRKAWGKKWPTRKFCELITALYQQGLNVITFIGPEEKDSLGTFRDALESAIPIIFEPAPRDFAAMISNCDLFVTCDSGPMHMACGLGIRTVAIFENPNFDHWGPPSSLARIVYGSGGCSAEEVFRICLEELFFDPALVPGATGEDFDSSSSMSFPAVSKALRRLENSVALQRPLFITRYAPSFFILSLLMYTWFFPPSAIFPEGTWTEELTDTVGFGLLIAGGLVRMWAASHGGKGARLYRPHELKLITTGPYAYIRHPVSVAVVLIGIGLIFLSDAFPLIVLLLALFALHHGVVIAAEEEFLKEKYGEGFVNYCDSVPKYIPLALPKRDFSFGSRLSGAEFASIWGFILTAYLFEWLESPAHRSWLTSVYQSILR